MKRNKIIYDLVNIIVLAAAAVLFVLEYRGFGLADGSSAGSVVIIVVSVLVVHMVKAFRLYLAMHGTGIGLSSYLKTYCKVTPVSVIYPFKLGELFRIYCYGHQMDNMLKSTVTVLLDRFMDTAALATVIFLVWLVNGGRMASFMYFLIIFLFAVILVYAVFPGIYRYWKKYILRADATPRRILFLNVIDKCNAVYDEITNITRGRGIILYFLSLIAWSVELGGLAVLSRANGETELGDTISGYLMAAMGSGNSAELRQFVFFSVWLMLIFYIVIKICDIIVSGKRDNT